MVLKNDLDRDAPGLFPPDLIIQVKAIACELPAKYGSMKVNVVSFLRESLIEEGNLR